MRMIPNRMLPISVVALLGGAFGCQALIDQIGGAYEGPPEAMSAAIGPDARRLIREAFEGLDPNRLVDAHVHMIGREVNRTWLCLQCPPVPPDTPTIWRLRCFEFAPRSPLS